MSERSGRLSRGLYRYTLLWLDYNSWLYNNLNMQCVEIKQIIMSPPAHASLFFFFGKFSPTISDRKSKSVVCYIMDVVCNPIADAAGCCCKRRWRWRCLSLPDHSTPFRFPLPLPPLFDIAIGLSRAFAFASLRPLYTHTADWGSVFNARFRGFAFVIDAHFSDLRFAPTLDYTFATF